MANSEPQDQGNSAEIQKNYADAISRATKFLISSAIILLILIVVVGQELREYRRKQKALVNQIESTAKSERAAVGKLYKKYACLRNDLNKGFKNKTLTEVAGVQLWEVPRRASSVRDPKDIEALVRDEQKLGELLRNVKEKLRNEKEEERRQSKQQDQESRDSASVRSVKAEAHYSIGESKGLEAVEQDATNQPENLQVSQPNDEPCAVPDGSDKDELSVLVSHLTQYRDLYNDRIGLARALVSITKEAAELKAAKKSIPTPFGSFQIAPKLALLGLAFALILAYFSFAFSVRKIRNLVNEYGGQGSPPIRIPAPFWSPNTEAQAGSSSPRHPKYFSTVLLSVSLHVIWLSLSAWLVFESVASWQATKVLAFDYSSFWGYLLIATLVGAVLVAAWQFVPIRLKRTLLAKNFERKALATLTRRRFVALGALSILGLLTLRLVRSLRKSNGTKEQRRQLPEFTATPGKDEWIQNKLTRILHYVPSCIGHLPHPKNQLKTITPENLGVHAGSQARILAELGARALKQKDKLRQRELQQRTVTQEELEKRLLEMDELSIAYFKKAIGFSPFSCHLYDKLCKTFGRLHRYAEIQPLFEAGLSQVQREMAGLANVKHSASTKRKLKFLRRKEEEFNSRIHHMKGRKKWAEFRAAKKRKQAEDKARKNNKPE